jgi:hypothetical protein
LATIARFNRHLVLGRRGGGTARVLTRLSLADLPDCADLALPARCCEVVGCDRDVKSPGGTASGAAIIAGVALLNHFLVDLDSGARAGPAGMAGRRGAIGRRPTAGSPWSTIRGRKPAPTTRWTSPWRLAAGVARRRTPTATRPCSTPCATTSGSTWSTALYYLPVEHNVWRGARPRRSTFAWSPAAIEAEMERRAELASLAVCRRSTELVLAHILEFAAAGDAPSPHVRGLGALARELTAALVAEGVAPADAAPARWAALPMPAFQRAARRFAWATAERAALTPSPRSAVAIGRNRGRRGMRDGGGRWPAGPGGVASDTELRSKTMNPTMTLRRFVLVVGSGRRAGSCRRQLDKEVA